MRNPTIQRRGGSVHPCYSGRKPTSAESRVGEGQVLDLTVPGYFLQTATRARTRRAVAHPSQRSPAHADHAWDGRWVPENTRVLNLFGCPPKIKNKSASSLAISHNCGLASAGKKRQSSWRTDMAPVERREAERESSKRCFSQAWSACWWGLLVATVLQSEQSAPALSQSVPGQSEPLNEPRTAPSDHAAREKADQDQHPLGLTTPTPIRTAGGVVVQCQTHIYRQELAMGDMGMRTSTRGAHAYQEVMLQDTTLHSVSRTTVRF